jgi:hypothetical protein
MRAISNRRLSASPQKGQLEPRVFVNDITQGGFEFCGGDVLGIEASQGVPANEVLGMAGGLRGPEFRGITKE